MTCSEPREALRAIDDWNKKSPAELEESVAFLDNKRFFVSVARSSQAAEPLQLLTAVPHLGQAAGCLFLVSYNAV